MARLYDWYEEKNEAVEKKSFMSTGLIPFALTVAAAVTVVTTIVTPFISSNVPALTAAANTISRDNIVTGSIAPPAPMKRYTIRRSILQPTSGAVCIIPDGSKKVQC